MSAIHASAALAASYGDITPALPTHWPNMAFTPPANALWVKPFFKWNEAVPHTNFADGLNEVTGFGQFDINGPIGQGEKAHNEVADRIREKFRVGSKHEYEGVEVTIMSIGKVEGFESDKYWKAIVSFTARFYESQDPALDQITVPDMVDIFNDELEPEP